MTPPVSLVHAEAISEEQPFSSSPQLLEEFYLRYRAPLLKLCAFWTKDPHLAEDLVHETILKAYLAIASYNPKRPVLAVDRDNCQEGLDRSSSTGRRCPSLSDSYCDRVRSLSG